MLFPSDNQDINEEMDDDKIDFFLGPPVLVKKDPIVKTQKKTTSVSRTKAFRDCCKRVQQRRTRLSTSRVSDQVEALHLMRNLQKKFPTSRENQVSNLSLLVLIKTLRLSYNQVSNIKSNELEVKKTDLATFPPARQIFAEVAGDMLPEGIEVTEKSATVPLQSLLDHTAQRCCQTSNNYIPSSSPLSRFYPWSPLECESLNILVILLFILYYSNKQTTFVGYVHSYKTSALRVQTHSPCCVERFHDSQMFKVKRRRIKSPYEDTHSIGDCG